MNSSFSLIMMLQWIVVRLSYFGAVALLSRVHLPLSCKSYHLYCVLVTALNCGRLSTLSVRLALPSSLHLVSNSLKPISTLVYLCAVHLPTIGDAQLQLKKLTDKHNTKEVYGERATCGLLRGSLPSGEGRVARSTIPPQGLRLRFSS